MCDSLKVRLPNGKILEVLVDGETETVATFKEKLNELIGGDKNFRLVVEGRSLKDEDPVVKAAADKVIYIVRETASERPTSPGLSFRLNDLNIEGDSGSSALSSTMATIMERNPELMKSIITSHPQLKAMMERSPQLREAMNNPQVIQDMIKLATNPQYYRESMRGADRAMSQLENIPQGFQMLRQLHEQIDDVSANPFDPKPSSKLHGSSPSAALQSKPLPNPWSLKTFVVSPSSSSSSEVTSKLEELRSLGFTDEERNKTVLLASKGNVQHAVEILLMDDTYSSESDDNNEIDK